MDLNKLEQRINAALGKWKDKVPGIWDKTSVEDRKKYLRDLLTYSHWVFREATDEMGCFRSPEGLQHLAEREFDDLPLSLWTLIRLSLNIENQTFSCDIARERLEPLFPRAS